MMRKRKYDKYSKKGLNENKVKKNNTNKESD
jgi:hypothetical protein